MRVKKLRKEKVFLPAKDKGDNEKRIKQKRR